MLAAERMKRLAKPVGLGEQLIQAFLDVLSDAINHLMTHPCLVGGEYESYLRQQVDVERGGRCHNLTSMCVAQCHSFARGIC